MRALLDTHAFLWYVLDDQAINQAAKSVIDDEKSEIFVSPASFWEIAIKVSIGKYSLTVPFEAFWRRGIEDNDFQILPVEICHAAIVASLPFHDKDPFDRLLAAQAIAHDLNLVSVDAIFDAYGVRRIW